MKSSTPMSLGEKIRQVRLAKGYSQENLAKATNTSKTYISRIERGDAECSDEMLVIIKKFLDIENAPLFEHELKLYKQQLLVWNELQGAHRASESEAMEIKLAPILKLPFERDLSLLYTMLKIKGFSSVGRSAKMEEAVTAVEPLPNDASIEVLHLYHYVKSYIYHHKHDFVNALGHSLKALKYESEDIKAGANLVFNIGCLYLNIGKPFHAISYLERAKAEYRGDSTNRLVYLIESMLGTCCIYLDDLKKAKGLCEDSLAHARRNNMVPDVMDALTRLSYISLSMNDYDKCLSICGQQITHINANTDPEYKHVNKIYHALALFFEARCFIETNKRDELHEALTQGASLAQSDESLTIWFESLRCISTLKDKESQEYLHNIALPHFLCPENDYYSTALYLCDKLEAHYRKNGATSKADAVGCISRDIYVGMVSDVE